MQREKSIKRSTAMMILAGILLAAILAGAMAFYSVPALAGPEATPMVEESDAGEAEDAAEGPDVPITGSALEKASAAALAYIGEGRVTETEVGDEEGYYEVEITLSSGSEVDVHLDEAFNVLGKESD